MKRFEYMQEQRLRIERLQELGLQGWELVSVSPFILKREFIETQTVEKPKLNRKPAEPKG